MGVPEVISLRSSRRDSAPLLLALVSPLALAAAVGPHLTARAILGSWGGQGDATRRTAGQAVGPPLRAGQGVERGHRGMPWGRERSGHAPFPGKVSGPASCPVLPAPRPDAVRHSLRPCQAHPAHATRKAKSRRAADPTRGAPVFSQFSFSINFWHAGPTRSEGQTAGGAQGAPRSNFDRGCLIA